MITVEQALKYLDKGWSIFPVIISWNDKDKKWDKKPAVKWGDYMTTRPTKDEINRWFGDGQYSAIGLVTGKISGVVVLDVEGYAKSEDYEDLKSGEITNTISGGKHFYYKWTKELRNTVKIRNMAIDFRGDGGYVVLPPSSAGDKSYTWEKEIDNMYLSPLPVEIEEQLVSDTSKPIEFIEGDIPFPPAGEGERNNEAARVSGYLCTVIPRKLWEISGWGALREWNKTNNPPMSEQELRTTWDSIKTRDVRNHPSRVSGDSGTEILYGREALTKHEEMMKRWGNGISTGFEEIDEYFKFLPDQLYLISAATHQGKTTLALNMAARMATLGSRPLFCSLEQGVFITPRVKTILGGEYPEDLAIMTSEKMVTVDDIDRAVNSMLYRPDVVMVDHLHFIDKDGKEKTEAMDDMIIKIQNLAKSLHLPILVIAHVRKLNADKAPEMDDLRDSSALSQVPSVVMMLHRKKNEDVNAIINNKSYLQKNGMLYLLKNRILGKTGAIGFDFQDSGEFDFGNKTYNMGKEVFIKNKEVT
jgi:hypothetical protein